MNNEIRFTDRVRYWVDNTFSKGTIALIAWLGVLSIVIIFVAAILLTLTGINQDGSTDRLTFAEAAWQALMRTFDAGTMGGDTGWGFRLIMLLVTIGGIFVISTLIGVLTSGVEGKLDELRKGRSRVIESNHTIILGWSEQIFTVLSELIIASQNQKKSTLVVMAEKDKIEMEDTLRERLGDTGKTNIICRTGSPIEQNDLHIVNMNSSKSIIVLSPESDSPDSEVIKTVLAITNYPHRRKEPYHIVAELHEPRNLGIARVVGKQEVEWILIGDLVARIISQTCRQSGLSTIYNELLDFGGDEIYLTQPPELIGKSYGEALLCFEKNAVMGICRASGEVQLNPPMNTVLTKTDQLIVIAADDDQINFKAGGASAVQAALISSRAIADVKAEKTLVLGWNWRGPGILRQLGHYVPAGSETLVVTGAEQAQEDAQIESAYMRIRIQSGDITDRALLEEIGVATYDHIILLSELAGYSPQQADSRTLIALLHLRDIADRDNLDLSITSEMIDVRNRNLAEVTRADDFIVSGRLISLMLAQVAENKALNAVFGDLFDPEGAEVYLKPVENYIALGKGPANFFTVVEAARLQGETAFGYRLQAHAGDASQAYGVSLNPRKSDPIEFHPGDKIVVLAES